MTIGEYWAIQLTITVRSRLRGYEMSTDPGPENPFSVIFENLMCFLYVYHRSKSRTFFTDFFQNVYKNTFLQ